MTKTELIRELEALEEDGFERDTFVRGVELLLEFIDDEEVTEAFELLERP